VINLKIYEISEENRIKPIDPVFMLKVLFLQRLYNISDNQVEYQIKDRMSFREFLDIQSVDDVPDEKTVWKYKNIMANAGIGIKLFDKFNEQLASMGLIVNEGKIVDASFVRHAAASNMSMVSWNRA
jgi:IS5 family transposase